MSDARPSFWTTMPGILTGLAALITALVGAAALFLGSGDKENPDTTSSSGVEPGLVTAGRGDVSTAEGAGQGPPSTLRVTMQIGESLDLDSGMVGTNVIGELNWISNQLNLYGTRNAVVTAETDRAGCITALQSRSDGWVTADRLSQGAVICLSTDGGAIAQARISPPDVTDNLAVEVTVWR